MKILYALFFAIIFNGCTNDPPELFEIYTENNITIPVGLDNVKTHYFVIHNVPTNIGNRKNSLPTDGAIYSRRASLVSTFSNFDASIVQSASIEIWDPMTPQDKKEAFYIDFQNVNNGEELRFFSSLPNLKDIMANDQFSIGLRIKFLRITQSNFDMRLNMTFVAYGEN